MINRAFRWLESNLVGKLLVVLVSFSMVGCDADAPQPTGAPSPVRSFTLNETMIEDLGSGTIDDACDYAEILLQLMAQIGPAADIYPSENYYYFSFARAGSLFSGSIRLSSDRRDDGDLDYVCYESYRHWVHSGDEIRVYRHLNVADGVVLDKLSDSVYRLTFDGLQTSFTLHQLDHARPGAPLLPADTRVGRTLDESGASFELIYNSEINEFYFLLDPQGGAPDTLIRRSPNTVISRRTGFVYFHQPQTERYVLVAVSQHETAVNSYFDGPFDHLPENDYAEIGFWDYVHKAYPDMINNHTPGGTVNAEGMIFSIRPYRLYNHLDGLGFVESCTATTGSDTDRLACMIWGH